MTKYKSNRRFSFFDALLRKKKIFKVSFGFSFLISFFVLLIIAFGIHDIHTIKKLPIYAEHYENAYNFYEEELEAKVEDYRKLYVKEYDYIKLEDFDEYKTPDPVGIKIRVNRIYDIDELTSSFLASGTIEAFWNNSAIQRFDIDDGGNKVHENSKLDVLSEAELDFYNAEDQYFQRVNLTNDPNPPEGSYGNYSKYKFKGRFRIDRDMRKFPFDSAYLRIRLSHNLTAPDIYLYIDKDSIMRDPQYRINSYNYIEEECYEDEKDENGKLKDNPKLFSCAYDEIEPLFTWGDSFKEGMELSDEFMKAYEKLDFGPSIVIRGKISRSISSSFFRYISPLLFGVLILTVNNYLSPKYNELRIATPPTILLTFIFMQSGFQAEIPQISYITYMDKIYLLCYFLAVISMLNAVLIGTNRNKISLLIQKTFGIPTSNFLKSIFIISAIAGPFILFIIP